jgi:large subunit ribosomal protein L29
MKAKELRELSVSDLRKKGRELREEALSLRIQQASGQLENPTRLRYIRRDVARIETVITERQATVA